MQHFRVKRADGVMGTVVEMDDAPGLSYFVRWEDDTAQWLNAAAVVPLIHQDPMLAPKGGVALNADETRVMRELFCLGGDYQLFVNNLRHHARNDTHDARQAALDLIYAQSAVAKIVRAAP